MDDSEIDQALVRSLLEDQHRDLAGLEIRAVDGGWDNMMWRLGDELAVRMPRLTRAPDRLRSEQRWLPAPAVRLPLAGPAPGPGRGCAARRGGCPPGRRPGPGAGGATRPRCPGRRGRSPGGSPAGRQTASR